jgi:hypothetical protein
VVLDLSDLILSGNVCENIVELPILILECEIELLELAALNVGVERGIVSISRLYECADLCMNGVESLNVAIGELVYKLLLVLAVTLGELSVGAVLVTAGDKSGRLNCILEVVADSVSALGLGISAVVALILSAALNGTGGLGNARYLEVVTEGGDGLLVAVAAGADVNVLTVSRAGRFFRFVGKGVLVLVSGHVGGLVTRIGLFGSFGETELLEDRRERVVDLVGQIFTAREYGAGEYEH